MRSERLSFTTCSSTLKISSIYSVKYFGIPELLLEIPFWKLRKAGTTKAQPYSQGRFLIPSGMNYAIMDRVIHNAYLLALDSKKCFSKKLTCIL